MDKLLFLIAALGLSLAAQAQQAGVVTHLSGTLSVKRSDGTSKLLSVKSAVKEGDLLVTEDETFARIKFTDGGEVVLRPNTQLKVEHYSFNEAKPENDKVMLNMLKGGLRAVTGIVGKRNRDNVQFNTVTATIGIRGTHLGALFCSNDCGGVPTPTGKTPDNGLHVDVAAGAVVVTPKLTVALPTGGTGTATTLPGGGTGAGTGSIASGTGSSTGGAGSASTTPSAPPQLPSPALGGGTSPVAPPPAAPPTPSAPPVVLNAGQFGYLPPPVNGVQPPMVLVPPSQAVRVIMPPAISQNKGTGGGIGASKDGECSL